MSRTLTVRRLLPPVALDLAAEVLLDEAADAVAPLWLALRDGTADRPHPVLSSALQLVVEPARRLRAEPEAARRPVIHTW